MNEFELPLQWGLNTSSTKELLDAYNVTSTIRNGRITIGEIRNGRITIGESDVKNFPGDCGSLLLMNANYATRLVLRAVKALASKGGFDKIFATLVMVDYEDKLNSFKKEGWQVLSISPSNRNPKKTAVALYLHITDPEYKGY